MGLPSVLAQTVARAGPEDLGRPQLRPAGERLEQPGEALGPFLGALVRRDQVLPDLDERIGKAPDGGVPVDRVARQRPIIGLVVADDESVLSGQSFEKRLGEAIVRVPEDAY